MKNVPKLRFSGFSEEWEEKKIGDFLTESRMPGSNGSIAKKLTVKLWAKGVVPKSEAYEGSDNTKYYIRKAGQLIYGKLDFLNCAFGIIPEELDGYESTLDAPAFDIKNIDSKFIYSRIIQKDFYKKNGETANGSRKAKRIHADVFFDMDIIVPSKEEQEKIANFLTKVDKLIEKQGEKVSNLEQYKKGMMQKIFSQEIRFKKDDGGEYSEWEERKIKEVADVITGNTPSTKVSENYGEEYMWASPVDLGNSKYIDKTKTQLSKIGFEKIRKLNSGSVLVTCIGSTIGKIAIASTKMSSNQQINAVYSINNNNEYIYYYLDYNFKNYLSYISFQAVPIINKSQFENFDIILPCIEEQDKIANFLSKIDSIVEKEKEKVEELRIWKKGLLQGLFM